MYIFTRLTCLGDILGLQREIQRDHHPLCDFSMGKTSGDGFDWGDSTVPAKRLETRREKKTKRIQKGWMVQEARWSNQ